jgi:signal transduction histidine kinase
MVIAQLLINVFHLINRFLATEGGELLKIFLELILFTIVTYMIISEYGRSKKENLKYLMLGFSALMIDKLIMTGVLCIIVFGQVKLYLLSPYLPILDNTLELFALILLANGFIYPVFADKFEKFKKKVSLELGVLVFIAIIIEVFWLLKLAANPTAFFRVEVGYLFFLLLKILVLFSPVFYILKDFNKAGKYATEVVIAFLIYMVAPIMNVINFVFFNSVDGDLRIIAHPFPFLSILLFTSIIFLKLVDKATLRVRLGQAKQQYIHEKELGEMKDDFVSTVSHELRTPLTSIKLYLALLKQGKAGKLSRKQSGMIKIVEDESTRLKGLIEDILGLSKLEAKKVRLKIEEFDLSKLIKDNLYSTVAEEKGLKVINNIPKKFFVRADINKFKQVFINIFHNAEKYATSKITLTAKNLKKEWLFCIEDDGPGIEKDHLEKLFDKFYRIEDYRTSSKSGTGLGLAIVKHIVELHKGTITVESLPKKGTRFIVTLPK